jgi:hypothetical protein
MSIERRSRRNSRRIELEQGRDRGRVGQRQEERQRHEAEGLELDPEVRRLGAPDDLVQDHKRQEEERQAPVQMAAAALRITASPSSPRRQLHLVGEPIFLRLVTKNQRRLSESEQQSEREDSEALERDPLIPSQVMSKQLV